MNAILETRSILTWRRRLSRAWLAVAVVAALLLAAPASPAWAKPKSNVNKDVVPTSDGESAVGAYLILVVGMGVGLILICRPSKRAKEPPRRGEL